MFDTQLNGMDSSLIHSGLDAIDLILSENHLAHSRTKGSKNGIRLYQNKDGTWTELGKERRRKGDGRKSKELVSGNEPKKTIWSKLQELDNKRTAFVYGKRTKKDDDSNTARAKKLSRIIWDGGDAMAVMTAKTGNPFTGEYSTESFKKAYNTYAKEFNRLSRLNPWSNDWDSANTSHAKASKELRTVMLKDLGIEPTEKALAAIDELTYTDFDHGGDMPPAKKYNPDPRIKELAKGKFV